MIGSPAAKGKRKNKNAETLISYPPSSISKDTFFNRRSVSSSPYGDAGGANEERSVNDPEASGKIFTPVPERAGSAGGRSP
jgi:hypothetical protein